ncbi:MAG: hypothetical protein QOJ99_434 [Bryobacterales bacterium]|nr:hypothetical protein [Bryobacterales bacterium]
MNVYRLLQYFLPLQNPVGFGLTDFLELGFTLLAVLFFVTRRKSEAIFRHVAERPALSMALLAALPAVLRLLLLRNHPVPVPAVSDDFSYLLLGDTLAHFRLANPAHPMARFFETVFVLQDPSYSSIYPLGQGLVLAFGQLVFRLPWAGVVLSVSMFCALCYWMLRGWVRPVWALAGGMLAVMEFGPLNQWMNNYWGGAVSAIAGCLVFGALPRLRRTPRRGDAALLGIGLGLQMLTRPFEFVLLALCVLPAVRRRHAAVALLAFLPFGALMLAQNKAVTGSFTTLPYMLSRYQYGIPATFTFQKNPVAHRSLNQEQAMDYQAQNEVHGNQAETMGTYLKRLAGRIRFFRFFFYAPLYLALFCFLPAVRRARYAWAVGSVLLFALGTNLYPYYYPHYMAAITCIFILMSVVGLERLGQVWVRFFPVGQDAMRLIALLCIAQFTFWFGLHFFGNDDLFIAAGPYESWDYINFGDSEGRMAIDRQLAASPGKHLVFVRYSPSHTLREWVYNEANIDSSRVVRALDLGPEENAKLIRCYPKRKTWLIEPDIHPPRLSAYVSPYLSPAP